jgi:hypothetical protein
VDSRITGAWPIEGSNTDAVLAKSCPARARLVGFGQRLRIGKPWLDSTCAGGSEGIPFPDAMPWNMQKDELKMPGGLGVTMFSWPWLTDLPGECFRTQPRRWVFMEAEQGAARWLRRCPSGSPWIVPSEVGV